MAATALTQAVQSRSGIRKLVAMVSAIALVAAGLVLSTVAPAKAAPAGVDWVSRQVAADNVWSSVTWGGAAGQEKFVAVSISGTGNRVMTSPDGATWTSQTSAADNNWQSATWGGPVNDQKFVAVAATGTGDRVMTSPDGVTWTSRTSATDNDWRSVAWGGGKFVAVSNSGTGDRVMTSPDGVTWTSQTSAADQSWRSVTWGGDKFVAVADNSDGYVMTSPDGIAWTQQAITAGGLWYSVAWGGADNDKKFVAIARAATGTDRVATSPDGVSWTLHPASNASWSSITWGGTPGHELFVVVSQSGAVMTSPDGIVWTLGTAAANRQWSSIAAGGVSGYEGFVAVSYNGTTDGIMTSNASYSLSYDPNGATGGTAPASPGSPYPAGSTVTVAGNTGNLAKAGSTFTGWNTAADGSGAGYKAGDTFRIGADTVLYAQWIDYSLSYSANGASGGTVPTDPNSPYVPGQVVTVLGNTGNLARSGYTFTGWNTAANGTGSQYVAGDTFVIRANTVLHAQWLAAGGQAPGKPRKLAVTGGPSAKKHQVRWKASKHANSQTRYIVRVKLKGSPKVLIRKTTKGLKVSLSRKQLLRATFGARGDVRRALVYRILVHAETAGLASPAASTVLRVTR